jgi:hypothetical protein
MIMGVQLNQEVIELLGNPQTFKVLTTVDAKGVPHAVVKESLTLGEDGNILVLEWTESSRTNRNLVRSIWFDQTVSILLKGEGPVAWQIRGLPIKAHVSGPVFQKHCVALRARLGDVDLAAVWVIRPEEVIDESPSVRHEEESTSRPTFIHLDRLVRV